MKVQSQYLGDGVYGEVRESMPDVLILYTSNGIEQTNRIFLEPEVIKALYSLFLKEIV